MSPRGPPRRFWSFVAVVFCVDDRVVDGLDDRLVKSGSNLSLLIENSMMSSGIRIGMTIARVGSILRAKEISRSVLFIIYKCTDSTVLSASIFFILYVSEFFSCLAFVSAIL